MRLQRAFVEPESSLFIEFLQSDGVKGDFRLPIPDDWEKMDRASKIVLIKQEITKYLENHTFVDAAETVYPNGEAIEQAIADLEALPGWGLWSASQATDWIENNVMDLASAKIALASMAKMLVYLRDILLGVG